MQLKVTQLLWSGEYQTKCNVCPSTNLNSFKFHFNIIVNMTDPIAIKLGRSLNLFTRKLMKKKYVNITSDKMRHFIGPTERLIFISE